MAGPGAKGKTMTRTKFSMAWRSSAARPTSPARAAASWALLAASTALDRLAQRLALPAETAEGSPPSELEFYAQAGAPEGALYVDGQFVGWLQGVQRL